jgi:hypothetical protein
MFGWIWRLTVVGSFAGCMLLGWGWLRSRSRSEAVYVNPPGRYLMAVSYRGRVTFVHVKDFPGADGERAWFGHTGAGAADDSMRQLQGGEVVFDLKPSSESSLGLLAVSEGTAESNIDGPRTETQKQTAVAPPPPPPPVVVKRPPVAKIAPPGPGSITMSRRPTTARASGAARTTAAAPVAARPVVPRRTPVHKAAAPTTRPSFAYRTVSLPHWLAIMILSLPGLGHVAVTWRRVRVILGRRRRGECVKCGADRKWDLGNQCPVCGTRDR